MRQHAPQQCPGAGSACLCRILAERLPSCACLEELGHVRTNYTLYLWCSNAVFVPCFRGLNILCAAVCASSKTLICLRGSTCAAILTCGCCASSWARTASSFYSSMSWTAHLPADVAKCIMQSLVVFRLGICKRLVRRAEVQKLLGVL